MSSREMILARLRSNRPDPDVYLLPDVAILGDQDRSRARFETSLAGMGGAVLERQGEETLAEAVARRFPDAKIICSAVPDYEGTLRIEDVTSPQQAAETDVMVVRAPFGIAETGSVFLSEAQLNHLNSAAHLAQHLVVILSEQNITANMHTAYTERQEFHTAHYGVLMSGPSATADIQGVLIRGAQGVRSLSVWWE
ncbi:LutC/YkgG family protein [Acetobacter thailandicus]|uniref:LutC/YkgG family protein n=1 Tax=Acetobacter thailandicus TaxID=1502842 RepID=UPI001BA91B7A|nr:LUD domain-containing protein [Acetobacter thailandicus]MBS1003042.1 LUD domain-containing protein [Acetobacter thailandicus]